MQKSRQELLKIIGNELRIWDVVVVGGGATGLGIALDAASRGFQTLLLEKYDFAKGTSSRSTKLVHGGVRYLAQGDIGLVMEALYERGILQKNAPHLVLNQRFVIPNYNWWEGLYYKIGLTLYDVLAGKLSFGHSLLVSGQKTSDLLPTLKTTNLVSGVVYHDGQFDDSRLAINLAQTAKEHGAIVLNYLGVESFIKDERQYIVGVEAIDTQTNQKFSIKANVVVNATGVFADDLLQKDQPHKKPLIRSSQGIHLVFDKSFLPTDQALMIPKTEDGRVLFAVPWHDKIVVGTTDTPLENHSIEPIALEQEVEFVLKTAGNYLTKKPSRKDVLSVFAGLRPLAAPQDGSTKTKEISRSHKIFVSESGLITITGGKWTTYRKMAEDVVNKAISLGKLASKICHTKEIKIHGATKTYNSGPFEFLNYYGSDKEAVLHLIEENPTWAEPIHPSFPYIKAQVVLAIRLEMALTVEDVLARRIRMLFLDAKAAMEAAPIVAELMAIELDKDAEWTINQISEFNQIAKGYLLD